MFNCSTISNSQAMEATQVPTNRVDKKAVVHIYNKKEWNLTICNSMDGLRGYYAKWNKSVRERQIPYDFTYMWNLKGNINEQTNQK